MSIPDHGEYEVGTIIPNSGIENQIDMAILFIKNFQYSGDPQDLEAAIALLNRHKGPVSAAADPGPVVDFSPPPSPPEDDE